MLETVDFIAADYGDQVARLLAMDGDGTRAMPLGNEGYAPEQVRAALRGVRAVSLFPRAFCPEGALSGLYLYFSCLDEAHTIAQDIANAEGSFWHGIMHRREPDPQNAAYWFRKVGRHPVFPALRAEAHRLRFDTGAEWDPFEFIEFCEAARLRPGSEEERIAMRIQLLEWQLLFDYCAKERTERTV